MLHISRELDLPAETATSTIVVYGGKGMGKTNCGSVLAEELAANHLRWAWLDPLGVSWGLRHSKDGRGRGVECLILGGVHGDVPIEPDGGAAVADVVVEESVNVLIDFSRNFTGDVWDPDSKIKFVTAYTRRLFQRQGDLIRGHRRPPFFQILDEAARFIPQNIPAGHKDLSKCLAAWQQIVEEGRNVGIGVGLISQRSAQMNKDVSELADAMIAFRTIGPNSLDSVLDWLGSHVDKAKHKELSQAVRQLPVGSALVVSPGWLEFEGVVQVRKRTTFDSSATPKAGERARSVQGEGAKPDLAAIRTRMEETIERFKADDPAELRKKIAQLELAAKTAKQEVAAAANRDDVDAAVARERAAWQAKVAELQADVDTLNILVAERNERMARLRELTDLPAIRKIAKSGPSVSTIEQPVKVPPQPKAAAQIVRTRLLRKQRESFHVRCRRLTGL